MFFPYYFSLPGSLQLLDFSLLTEQAKFIDDFLKLFSKGMGREAAEAVAKRIEILFVKNTKSLGNVFNRLQTKSNIVVKDNIFYIIAAAVFHT